MKKINLLFSCCVVLLSSAGFTHAQTLPQTDIERCVLIKGGYECCTLDGKNCHLVPDTK